MGPTDTPTRAERHRMSQIQEIGCIVSQVLGRNNVPAQVHHVLSGGRRLGHMHTIGLTPWYHEGEVPEGLTRERCHQIYGPSLKLHRREFTERFGTEAELVELTSRIIEWLDQNPFRGGLSAHQAPALIAYQVKKGFRKPRSARSKGPSPTTIKA